MKNEETKCCFMKNEENAQMKNEEAKVHRRRIMMKNEEILYVQKNMKNMRVKIMKE